jgi:exonuclease VII small subunit
MSYITRFEELVRQLDELVSEIETEASDKDVDLDLDFDTFILDPIGTLQEEGLPHLQALVEELDNVPMDDKDDPNQTDMWAERKENPARLDKEELL